MSLVNSPIALFQNLFKIEDAGYSQGEGQQTAKKNFVNYFKKLSGLEKDINANPEKYRKEESQAVSNLVSEMRDAVGLLESLEPRVKSLKGESPDQPGGLPASQPERLNLDDLEKIVEHLQNIKDIFEIGGRPSKTSGVELNDIEGADIDAEFFQSLFSAIEKFELRTEDVKVTSIDPTTPIISFSLSEMSDRVTVEKQLAETNIISNSEMPFNNEIKMKEVFNPDSGSLRETTPIKNLSFQNSYSDLVQPTQIVKSAALEKNKNNKSSTGEFTQVIYTRPPLSTVKSTNEIMNKPSGDRAVVKPTMIETSNHAAFEVLEHLLPEISVSVVDVEEQVAAISRTQDSDEQLLFVDPKPISIDRAEMKEQQVHSPTAKIALGELSSSSLKFVSNTEFERIEWFEEETEIINSDHGVEEKLNSNVLTDNSPVGKISVEEPRSANEVSLAKENFPFKETSEREPIAEKIRKVGEATDTNTENMLEELPGVDFISKSSRDSIIEVPKNIVETMDYMPPSAAEGPVKVVELKSESVTGQEKETSLDSNFKEKIINNPVEGTKFGENWNQEGVGKLEKGENYKAKVLVDGLVKAISSLETAISTSKQSNAPHPLSALEIADRDLKAILEEFNKAIGSNEAILFKQNLEIKAEDDGTGIIPAVFSFINDVPRKSYAEELFRTPNLVLPKEIFVNENTGNLVLAEEEAGPSVEDFFVPEIHLDNGNKEKSINSVAIPQDVVVGEKESISSVSSKSEQFASQSSVTKGVEEFGKANTNPYERFLAKDIEFSHKTTIKHELNAQMEDMSTGEKNTNNTIFKKNAKPEKDTQVLPDKNRTLLKEEFSNKYTAQSTETKFPLSNKESVKTFGEPQRLSAARDSMLPNLRESNAVSVKKNPTTTDQITNGTRPLQIRHFHQVNSGQLEKGLDLASNKNKEFPMDNTENEKQVKTPSNVFFKLPFSYDQALSEYKKIQPLFFDDKKDLTLAIAEKIMTQMSVSSVSNQLSLRDNREREVFPIEVHMAQNHPTNTLPQSPINQDPKTTESLEKWLDARLAVSSRGWTNSLSKSIISAIQRGQNSIRVALSPPTLGYLRISFSNQRNGLDVKIDAQRRATITLMSDAQPKIISQLETAGHKVNNFSLSEFSDLNQNFNSNNKKDYNRNGEEQDNPAPKNERLANVDQVEAESSENRPRKGDGSIVDIRL